MSSIKPSAEKDLLFRVRNQDIEAFDEIYRLYYPRLRAYVLKFVKVPQHTEDIVQDVFVKLWEVRESIDPEKHFSAYLFTITKNLVFKFFKTVAHKTELIDDVIISMTPGNPGAEQSVEWKELNEEINRAIDLLPPKRKQVFLLCRQEEMSYDAASEKLHISRNTIKEHMVLAMKFIKTYLKERSLYTILPAMIALVRSAL